MAKSGHGITESALRRQVWKPWFVLAAWPLFLFLVPVAWREVGAWSLVLAIFPGAYLYAWMGVLMHECWHGYLPNLPNRLVYRLLSWMMVADPQIFGLVHGDHHAKAHTHGDIEFHPFGEIKSRRLKALNNLAEIVIGSGYMVAALAQTLRRHPRFKKRFSYARHVVAFLISASFIAGLGGAAHGVFGASLGEIAWPYLAAYWLGSLALHHNQLIEHGNVIAPGSLAQRNILTRHLAPSGPAERLFLFLAHNDTLEHVLHHTTPEVHSRPFPGVLAMPRGAPRITFGDYLGILGDMLRGRPCSFTAKLRREGGLKHSG